MRARVSLLGCVFKRHAPSINVMFPSAQDAFLNKDWLANLIGEILKSPLSKVNCVFRAMHKATNHISTISEPMVKSLTNIFYRIHCEKITFAARFVWTNQEIADDIASNALQILAKASRQNLRFFCGKSPKCLLGGLFYILGFRFKSTKTQREIANYLCTTEDSIRKSYKSWLSEFPQFFTDIADLKLPKAAKVYRESIEIQINSENITSLSP